MKPTPPLAGGLFNNQQLGANIMLTKEWDIKTADGKELNFDPRGDYFYLNGTAATTVKVSRLDGGVCYFERTLYVSPRLSRGGVEAAYFEAKAANNDY